MNRTRTALFCVFTVLAAGCSTKTAPPTPAPAKGTPAAVRPQSDPVAKVTAVPHAAPATGQAIGAPLAAPRAENAPLGRKRDGRPATLADYRGRAVLAIFWSSRCLPCAGEMAAVEGLRRQFETKGLVVLAVNVGDKAAEADGFVVRQKTALRMTQLLDADRSAARGLGVRSVPTTLLFDASGQLRRRYGGYSGLDAAQLRRELDHLLGSG